MRDLLVIGPIHTMEPARPLAEAVLIRSGRFACVGSAAECAAQAGADADRLSLGKGSAIPGLVEAHGHVLLYGRSLLQVDCGGTASEADCAQRVAGRARGTAPGEWIQGQGWDQNRWPGRQFPTEASLSRAAPDHPVALERADYHALWANARALQIAGIGALTADPPGGRIVRRPDGSPSGVLVDTATRLVTDRIPPLGDVAQEEALLAALRDLVAAGFTAVHDAGVGPGVLEVYRRLALGDRLPLRVYAMIDGQVERPALAEQLSLWRRTPEVGRLTVRAVKMFADGALGSRGAALREPYSDDPGNSGLLLLAPDELRERVRLVAKAGFQPAVHGIGDRACGEALAAFAGAAAEVDLARLRPRLEHAQFLLEPDLQQLAQVHAVASMQPIHAVGDAPWVEERLGRGTPRLKGAYAWRRVLDLGVPLAFGSDFPVDTFDPRLGLQAAELRLAQGTGRPWMPEQTLTRVEALRAYTEGGAFAAHADDRRGRIQVGQEADLTAFAPDLLDLPAAELPRAEVILTVVGGRVEYSAGTPR